MYVLAENKMLTLKLEIFKSPLRYLSSLCCCKTHFFASVGLVHMKDITEGRSSIGTQLLSHAKKAVEHDCHRTLGKQKVNQLFGKAVLIALTA